MNYLSTRLFFILLILSLTACVNTLIATHQTSLDNLELIRKSNFSNLAVGNFALAPGKDISIDKSVSARAVTMTSPHQNSFAQYLREAAIADLKSGAKYDPQALFTLSGLLTSNHLEASMPTGKGSVGAVFSLHKGSTQVYQKELVESAQWPSAFLGVTAIGDALNQYSALYQKLLAKLFGDADFQKAASSN